MRWLAAVALCCALAESSRAGEEHGGELLAALQRRFIANDSLSSTVFVVSPEVDGTVSRLLSVLRWVGGPFALASVLAHPVQLSAALLSINATALAQQLELTPRKTPRAFLFDSAEDLFSFEELSPDLLASPLGLRSFLATRHAAEVHLQLPAQFPSPLELHWADFRGNTRLVRLGAEAPWGVLLPRGVEIQFSAAGHLFVTMRPAEEGGEGADVSEQKCELEVQGTEEGGEGPSSPYVELLRTQLHRVRGLVLVPPLREGDAIKVDLSRPLFNAAQLLSPRCRLLLETDIKTDNNTETETEFESRWDQTGGKCGAFATRDCFREALLHYWRWQRFSQVGVQQWAVPALPLATLEEVETQAEAEIEAEAQGARAGVAAGAGVGAWATNGATNGASKEAIQGSTRNLWTLVDLPPHLTARLQAAHLLARLQSVAEPPISLVFNQLTVSSHYAPLPVHLLAELEGAVRGQMVSWLRRLEHAGVEGDAGTGAGAGAGADVDDVGSLEGDSGNLELTGQYACREYRSGAVVRWHTDPAESQPLTAIVHIAHQLCRGDRGGDRGGDREDETGDESGGDSAIRCDDSSSNDSSSCRTSGSSDGSGDACGSNWAITLPSSLHSFCAGALCPCAGTTEAGVGTGVEGGVEGGVGIGEDVGAGEDAGAGAAQGEEAPCPAHTSLQHIFLRPGQVLLLQSAKLPHAREQPLRGAWYANAFFHYRPAGWQDLPAIRDLGH
ncbi:hypothetical protein B484DRAFT_447576 [Ochromonadaceae sp. CCMP2298]|nr:hypothetical protein B484DRAFT_447576 [Ochromonadaceae sp. CCMP2298]